MWQTFTDNRRNHCTAFFSLNLCDKSDAAALHSYCKAAALFSYCFSFTSPILSFHYGYIRHVGLVSLCAVLKVCSSKGRCYPSVL